MLADAVAPDDVALTARALLPGDADALVAGSALLGAAALVVAFVREELPAVAAAFDGALEARAESLVGAAAPDAAAASRVDFVPVVGALAVAAATGTSVEPVAPTFVGSPPRCSRARAAKFAIA